MFNYLNENKMISEARQQGKSRSFMTELMIYFIIMLVINFITGLFSTPAIFYILFSDAEMINLMMSPTADYAELMQRMYNIMANLPEWLNILSLFLCVIMIAVPVFYCKFIEKRSISSMGFRKPKFVSEYLNGFAVGIIMMGAVALLCVLSGAVTYEGIARFSVPVVIFYFIGYMIQGMAEETLIRGYFMISSAKSTTLSYSLLMSSMLFSFAHFGNTGISFLGYINIFLFGIFAGIYVIRRGNIWGIGALHASWNFTQGILFGFNVSGYSSRTSILKFVQIEGLEKLNGGSFGPEGGLMVTLILFLAIGIILVSKPNKNEVVITENLQEIEEK